MYKLLVVEDEKSIAYGIANSIPWQEWGFIISGICGNGLEAIDEIEKNKPDVVISDIRMPEMDGIELMQHLNQNYPEIKIIILSGYNDFEYLQMSIKNQVKDNNGVVPTRGSGNYESDEAKENARLRRELRDTQDALEIE